MTPWKINLAHLLHTTSILLARQLPYVWGGKANPLSTPPENIKGFDCSGYVEYGLYWGSLQIVKAPQGGVLIHDWLDAQIKAGVPGLRKCALSDRMNNDGLLRISFIRPTPGFDNGIGHVWFDYLGWTMESHGGKGMDRRPSSTPLLVQHATDCYIIPTTNHP